MTPNNFCFYLQNRLIQTGKIGGQRYTDTPPFSIPWMKSQVISRETIHLNSWDNLTVYLNKVYDYLFSKLSQILEQRPSLWGFMTLTAALS
jgi:hypothetical protein